MNQTTVNKIAEGDWFKFLSRGSMLITPALLATVFFTTQGWLTGILTRHSEAITAFNSRLNVVELDLSKTHYDLSLIVSRVAVIENQGKSQERFEAQTLAELRDIRTQLTTLTARVSALDATIQTLRDKTDGKLQRSTQQYYSPIYPFGYTGDGSIVRGSPPFLTELQGRNGRP